MQLIRFCNTAALVTRADCRVPVSGGVSAMFDFSPFFPFHFFPLFSHSSLTHVLYEKQSGVMWVVLWWCSHHFHVLVPGPVPVQAPILVPGLPFAASPDSAVPDGFSLPASVTMHVSKSSKVSLAGSTELMRAEVKVPHSAVLGSELSNVKARSLGLMVNFMLASRDSIVLIPAMCAPFSDAPSQVESSSWRYKWNALER